MPVVTINGEVGSKGADVGRAVAAALGIDLVDRRILAAAAGRIGATVEALEQKDERPTALGNRVVGFLERMLGRSAVGGVDLDYAATDLDVMLGRKYEEMGAETITEAKDLDEDRYTEVLSQVVRTWPSRATS